MPGGMRKYGRNQLTCQRYKDSKTRFKNKLKKVKQSNGRLEAINYERYFDVHGTQRGYKPHRRKKVEFRERVVVSYAD